MCGSAVVPTELEGGTYLQLLNLTEGYNSLQYAEMPRRRPVCGGGACICKPGAVAMLVLTKRCAGAMLAPAKEAKSERRSAPRTLEVLPTYIYLTRRRYDT